MNATAPRVSVVVATYQPGDALDRLVDSLDAQTLSHNDFEVIFIDDGSPDDTYELLRRIATARPNVQALRIEHSGSAGRTRNVGIEHARGEYVLFLDQGSSLFPDGLARAYEYAAAHRADILNPKELKTNDPWWGLAPLAPGSAANVLPERGIFRLMPMVTHKLYRRQLLLDNAVRFPEGARSQWEDAYVNVAAYRHARVVSVLADVPVYVWHDDSRSSDTFDPLRRGYWDRLDELMEFLVTTLDVPGYEDARLEMLAQYMSAHVLGVLKLLQGSKSLRGAVLGLHRARRLVRRYSSADVLALLPANHRVQAYLLLNRRPDRIWQARRVDLRLNSATLVRSLRWRDGVLCAELECRWEPQSRNAPGLRRVGDRVLRDVDSDLAKALPAELLDVTDDADELTLQICARARTGYAAWSVPVTLHETSYESDENGGLCLVGRGEATVDIAGIAGGGPLGEDVWDFKTNSEWIGFRCEGELGYRGSVRPAVVSGRGAVAYQSNSGALALDTAGRERTLAVDARPRSGVPSPLSRLAVPLGNLTVFGTAGLDAGELVAVPEDDLEADASGEPTPEQLERYAATSTLRMSIVAGAAGTRLEGSARLNSGRYRIYARRGGRLRRTARSVVVDDGGELEFT